SVRHAVPPGRQGGSPRPDSSPSVILPALMNYFWGSTLAESLRDPHPCLCDPCAEWGEIRGKGEAGRPLTDFQDSADATAALAHNMAIWSRWWRQLRSQSPEARKERWRGMCRRAHNEYSWYNALLSPREKMFQVSPSLCYWAETGGRGCTFGHGAVDVFGQPPVEGHHGFGDRGGRVHQHLDLLAVVLRQ